MHRVEILRVVGIDECAKGHDEVARSDALPRECMAARAIEDARRALVLVDDLHRHEASVRLRRRDRNRAGVKIEHSGGVERVAVETDHGLIVDRGRRPGMRDLAEPVVLGDAREVKVALGSHEIIGVDRDDGGRRGDLRELRRFPLAVERRRLQPIEAQDSKERPIRRWKPVRLLVGAGTVVARIEGSSRHPHPS